MTEPDLSHETMVVERNRLLYGALPTSVVATLVLAAVLAGVQSAVLDIRLTVGWFVGMSLLTLIRLLFARSHRPRAEELEEAERYETRFAYGALAGGIGWGAAGLILFPADVMYQAFLGFVIAGVSAGAMGSLAASFPALLAFLVPALLPLAIRLLSTEGTVPLAMGLLTLLFLIFLIGSGRRIGGMINDTIRLRLADARREAEVRRSRDLLERVGTIARVGGWEWDLRTGSLHWSEQMYRLYGLDPASSPATERVLGKLTPEGREAFERAVDRAISHHESYDLELRVEDGEVGTRWVRAQGKPVVEGGETVRIVGTLQDVTERRRTAERLKTNLEALQRLHQITAGSAAGLGEKIGGILELGLDAFGLELGVVSRIGGRVYRVEHALSRHGDAPEPGTTFDLGETYCTHVLAADGPVAYEEVGTSDIAGHPCYEKFGLEAYVGTPILVDGRTFGTLNFSSLQPRPEPFTDLDLALIRILAEWIGHELSRVRALGDLAESEERNRLILDSVGDGIYGLDREGRTTFVNPAAEQILGYSAEEVLGEFMHELVHHSRPDGSEYPVSECPTTRTFAEGEPVTVADEVLWTREGRPVPVEYTSTPVRADDAFVGAVVSFRDVTERKEYERRLMSTLAMQRAILDSANYAIIATDADGVIHTFSRGAERMLGYTEEEVVGRKTPVAFHDPEEVEKRARALTEELGREVEPGFDVLTTPARTGEKADERKWTYVRKEGRRIPVLLSVAAVRDDEGTPMGYVGIAADLTEREKVDRLKSEFVSTVSHELRTPLTSIRGSLGLVAGGATGELPDRARELIRVASRNSERLILLINDILDMEKIESGRLEFSISPHPLMALVERALEANEAYAREHSTRFVLTSTLPAEVRVNVDENRLAQAVTNLLSNAAKFTDEGTAVEVGVALDGEAARIDVTDHGPGIPESFRARIFQKFSQADASDRRQKGGTGLGLSITRALVQRMGGSVWFETEVGEGTTFSIRLPLWAPEPDRPPRRTGDRGAVLVCEPDPESAERIVEVLEDARLEAVVVGTPAEVRERLSRAGQGCGALLLDMAAGDGATIELIRWIRSHERLVDLPIVSLAVRTENGELTLGGELRLFDWLEKPVSRPDLERIIARLERTRDGRPAVLHVEDDADLRHTVAALGRGLADFQPAESLDRARAALAEWDFDLVLLDLDLPDGSGWDLLPDLGAAGSRPSVVVFSAHSVSAEDAQRVEAALMKSRTSEDELLTTLHRLLAGRTAPAGHPEEPERPEGPTPDA